MTHPRDHFSSVHVHVPKDMLLSMYSLSHEELKSCENSVPMNIYTSTYGSVTSQLLHNAKAVFLIKPASTAPDSHKLFLRVPNGCYIQRLIVNKGYFFR